MCRDEGQPSRRAPDTLRAGDTLHFQRRRGNGSRIRGDARLHVPAINVAGGSCTVPYSLNESNYEIRAFAEVEKLKAYIKAIPSSIIRPPMKWAISNGGGVVPLSAMIVN